MSEEQVHTRRAVGVVLVNWNGAEYTIPCIESLLAGTVMPEHIVVVDNASRDGSPDLIAKRFPGVELIRNSKNLGFTGANNIGISRLMTAGCDYLWVLNNDTLVDAACLERLKTYMDSHPEAAACSGKILYAEPADQIWYAGATYSAWTLQFRHRGQGERDLGRYERDEEVPFLSGCCMFIRKSAARRIGLFDNQFFAYHEDSDWCLRARNAGLRLHYVPQAVIRHKVSATVNSLKRQKTGGLTSPFSVYIVTRNRWYLIRKHARGMLQGFTASLSYAAWNCYYGSALLLLGRTGKLKALIMACYDGLAAPLDPTPGEPAEPRYLR